MSTENTIVRFWHCSGLIYAAIGQFGLKILKSERCIRFPSVCYEHAEEILRRLTPSRANLNDFEQQFGGPTRNRLANVKHLTEHQTFGGERRG